MMREDTRSLIKFLVLLDQSSTVDDLRQQLARKGINVSAVLVAGVKKEFLHSLRFLQREGLCPKDIKAAWSYRAREVLPPLPIKKKPFKPWWFNG